MNNNAFLWSLSSFQLANRSIERSLDSGHWILIHASAFQLRCLSELLLIWQCQQLLSIYLPLNSEWLSFTYLVHTRSRLAEDPVLKLVWLGIKCYCRSEAVKTRPFIELSDLLEKCLFYQRLLLWCYSITRVKSSLPCFFRVVQGTFWASALCAVFSWWWAVRKWERGWNATSLADNSGEDVRSLEMYHPRRQHIKLWIQHPYKGRSLDKWLEKTVNGCSLH